MSDNEKKNEKLSSRSFSFALWQIIFLSSSKQDEIYQIDMFWFNLQNFQR